MLEIFAQMVAFAAFSAHLPDAVTAFIDNTAGQAALSKGYGKDPAINGMLALPFGPWRRRSGAPWWNFGGSRRRPTWSFATTLAVLGARVDQSPHPGVRDHAHPGQGGRRPALRSGRGGGRPDLPPGLLSRRVVGLGAPGGADMRTRRRL